MGSCKNCFFPGIKKTYYMKSIILASSSPRRKQLLEQIGLSITVVSSNFDEKLNPRLKPRSQVEYLAEGKAKAVVKNYSDAIIIAADTVVVLNDEIIGKPASIYAAKNVLRRLSGKCHSVITGFCILDTEKNKSITKSVETLVYFKKLSNKEVTGYIAGGEPMDKAGAYGIQGRGAVFIEKISGDYFNIVGLPLSAVVEELKRFGVSIW